MSVKRGSTVDQIRFSLLIHASQVRFVAFTCMLECECLATANNQSSTLTFFLPPSFLPFLSSLSLLSSLPSILSPFLPLSLPPSLPSSLSPFLPQHKLKQSQRSKVRQFITITGTDEHTAINCLTQNEWRLDMATDNFYQDPIRYFVEPPRAAVDRKKLDSLFNKYRSMFIL